MKNLAVYVIFVIAICALALGGNKAFYLLASVYEYGIYIFLAAVALIIVAFNFMPGQNNHE